MKLSFLLLLCLAASAPAQSDFRAYPVTENQIENAHTEKLVVMNGNLRFKLRPPRDWSRWVDETGRTITFTSPSTKSAVTIQFTTNSPGTLPETDLLKAQAQQEHPGTVIFYSSVCPTSDRPGVFFDMAGIPVPHVVHKIRHAFVAGPAGEVEFVLSASDDEFDKNSPVLMSMLKSFRADPIQPKQQ